MVAEGVRGMRGWLVGVACAGLAGLRRLWHTNPGVYPEPARLGAVLSFRLAHELFGVGHARLRVCW